VRFIHRGRTRFAVLAAVVATAAGLVSAPGFSSAQTSGSWPTFHGTASRDGTLAISGPTTSTRTNKFTLIGPTSFGVSDSPVVDSHGIAYIADNAGNAYALDPNTHAVKWQVAVSPGSPITTSPGLSADGGTVFIGSSDGNLYALSTSNGSVQWHVSLGVALSSSPIVSPDGSSVYTGTVNGTLYSISTSSHGINWSYNLPSALPLSFTLGQNGTVIYAASGWFIYPLSATNPSSSSNLGVYYLDGAATSSPAVDTNGIIYIGTGQGTVDAFQPGTPAPKWSFPAAGGQPITTTPAIANGTVVVGSDNGYVYGLSAANGSQTWQQLTGGAVQSSPVIATGNNIAYVGSSDGKLYAYNLQSGTPVWSYPLGTAVKASPALSPDGSVWATTTSGDVWSFNKLSSPPGPTAGPTLTPGPTNTPGPTSTPGPTATPTTALISISATASGGTPGKTVTLSATTTANQTVHFLVTYPNGDHHSASAKSNASGKATAHFTQPASKITHNNFTATVTAKVTVNGASSQATAQYTIKLGSIDLSVEPRSQAAGKKVGIWLHTKARTRTVVAVMFPNHSVQHKHGNTNASGWIHWNYKIPKGRTTASSNTVKLRGSTVNRHPNVTTTTSFKVT
jgi:outer membrane protein assembly factor BamB